MARPENWQNQGYVPTPGIVSSLIGRYFRSNCYAHNNEKEKMAVFNILDPCCGEGDAIVALRDLIHTRITNDRSCYGDAEARFHRVRAWGVELNEDRAELAAKVLFRVFKGDFLEETAVEPYAFQAAWVNPPYGDMDSGQGRAETKFLIAATEALCPGGLLFYIVPEKVADNDLSIIHQSYTNVAKIKFPLSEYEHYSQVVVLGIKRTDPLLWASAQSHAIHSKWANQVWTMPDSTEVGRNAGTSVYLDLQSDMAENRMGLISRRPFNLETLNQIVRNQGVWHSSAKVRNAVDPEMDVRHKRPLFPLRKGHLIIQVANGQLNNAELYDPSGVQPPMIVRGSATKIQEEESSTKKELVLKDKVVTVLQTMNLDTGEVATINESDGAALSEFLLDNWESIEEYSKVAFEPSINPTDPKWESIRSFVRQVERPPISYQYPSIVTLAAAIKNRPSTYLIGEQGTGKTYMSMVAAVAAGAYKILVTTPLHAIETWIEEIKETFPQARIRIAYHIGCRNQPLNMNELESQVMEMPISRIRMMEGRADSPIFVLISKERARNTYRIVNTKRMVGTGEGTHRLFKSDGRMSAVAPEYEGPPEPTCPHCWELVETKKNKFKWHQTSDCPHCGQRLATPDAAMSEQRPFALADYIVKQMPWWADLYIADEVHQYKAGDTAQGEQCGRIAQATKKTLAMTGTFMGGKSSEMFYILQRFGKDFSPDYHWDEMSQFIEKFGRYKHIYTSKNGDAPVRVGTQSRRRAGQSNRKEEIVGFHPAVMQYILPNAIFVRREDIVPGKPLETPETCKRCGFEYVNGYDNFCWRCRMNPRYENILIDLDDTEKFPMIVEDEDGAVETEMTQKGAYDLLSQVNYQIAKDCLVNHNSIAAYAELRQNLMTYPENCWQGAVIHQPLVDEKPVIFTMSATGEAFEYPKETKLVELVKKERDEGRKCLVYCTHTQTRSTVERVEDLLTRNGVKVAIMNVQPRERLAWLRKTSKEVDVVIVNPKSVETGLNLQEYPTMIWYEINESMYVTDQASARSARLNQKEEVRVYFMAYQNTLQHIMITLIATKSDMARRIYGELGATGLSALNPDDTSMKQVIERELFKALQDQTATGIDWSNILGDEDINKSFIPEAPPTAGDTFTVFDMDINDEPVAEEALSRLDQELLEIIEDQEEITDEQMESGQSFETSQGTESAKEETDQPDTETEPAVAGGEAEPSESDSEPKPEPVKTGVLSQLGWRQKKQIEAGQLMMF